MSKIDRHIKIEEELHYKIIGYTKESKKSYSEVISNMIEEAITNKFKQSQLNKIDSEIITLSKKVSLMFELIKQLYSDLNLTNITDPKKSYCVNEFLRKVRISKLDE